MAQTPAKTKDHPDVQRMHKQREEINKSNEEATKRMESTQPTPTQEENDLAKLGVAVEDKEPDGSGPTIIRNTTVANVPLGYERETIADPYKADETTGKPTGQGEAERKQAERDKAAREFAEREKAARK